MSSFYQSSLRTHILRDIYKRSCFDVDICGVKYMGQMKQKTKLGVASQWYMIHGIELHTIENYHEAFAASLKCLKRDFGKSRGDMFFQLGITNTFESKATQHYKDDTAVEQNLVARKQLQQNFSTRYNLKSSVREHMPEATVVLDLALSDEDRRHDYSNSGKRYLNKGKKAGLSFCVASDEEWQSFYHTWYTTAFDKGFGVIAQSDFDALQDFCLSENKGHLFLAKKGDAIVAGSLCLIRDKTLVYLYGATDRSYGDIGAHYWLTDKICSRAKQHGFVDFDLLGIAPFGYPKHHLAGVSRFKQSFGGKAISYAGNFDYIFNPLLYNAFKILKQ